MDSTDHTRIPVRRRRRWAVCTLGLVAVLTFGACVPGAPGGPPSGPGADPGAGPCPMFPADNYWFADVSSLPEHPRSGAWRSEIGLGAGLKADFGSGTWDGGPIGIPSIRVGAAQPRVPISFYYPDESDPGPYPIPLDAPVEFGSDHHVIVVDESDCTLYEVYDATLRPDGSWDAGSGATWNLRSNALRPDGWTSADAAGLPMLPGLVRFDEVASGRINHALRFTAPRTQRDHLWPARHDASNSTDSNLPPLGAWFRLRPDYDTSWMHPQARVIAEALKVHGMILADNGSSWFISGSPDERWDNDGLRDLLSVTGSDLVAVDAEQLRIDPDSGRHR